MAMGPSKTKYLDPLSESSVWNVLFSERCIIINSKLSTSHFFLDPTRRKFTEVNQEYFGKKINMLLLKWDLRDKK